MSDAAIISALDKGRRARQRGATGDSRQEALDEGLRYYNGAPCKECNGDVPAVRYTSTRACTYCVMQKRYDLQHDSNGFRAKRARYNESARLRRKDKRAQLAQRAMVEAMPDLTSPMAQILARLINSWLT